MPKSNQVSDESQRLIRPHCILSVAQAQSLRNAFSVPPLSACLPLISLTPAPFSGISETPANHRPAASSLIGEGRPGIEHSHAVQCRSMAPVRSEGSRPESKDYTCYSLEDNLTGCVLFSVSAGLFLSLIRSAARCASPVLKNVFHILANAFVRNVGVKES
jgi:hypothetical protein